MTELDFNRDMAINPDCLDVECLDHANLYIRYSNAAIHAARIAKRAAEKKKTIRSKLTKEANKDPKGCGIEKVTGPNVEAYYRDHDDYKDAVNELIDAEYEADMLKGAVESFGYQRKEMLRLLVQEWQGQYFAGPNLPRDLKKEWAESGRDSVVDRQRERKAGRARK